MDGRTDGRTDGGMDGWMDGWMDAAAWKTMQHACHSRCSLVSSGRSVQVGPATAESQHLKAPGLEMRRGPAPGSVTSSEW